MKEYQGKLVVPAKAKFAVLVSRFNEFITSKLLGGCLDALKRHGADEGAIEVVWSPGSFEIPVLAQRLACSGRYAAVICLGAVIRGGPAIRSTRRSSGPEPRPATRAPMRPCRPSRWST